MEARHLPDKKADGNFVTLVRLGHICIVPKNRSRRTEALTTSHFVKSYVSRKHLEEAMEAHKDAADELKERNGDELLTAARWRSLEEVRGISKDADDGDDGDDFVIFNIRHNRYRLIAVVQ